MAVTPQTLRYFPESGDYLTFVEEFLLKNEPCLFRETLTRGWRARREWQRNGKPDLDYLASEFGTLCTDGLYRNTHFLYTR